MNRDLAHMVVNSAARARVEIGNLMPTLKEHGDEAADEPIRMAIASAVYEIGLVMDRVFEAHPDLKREYESRLDAYGRSYF